MQYWKVLCSEIDASLSGTNHEIFEGTRWIRHQGRTVITFHGITSHKVGVCSCGCEEEQSIPSSVPTEDIYIGLLVSDAKSGCRFGREDTTVFITLLLETGKQVNWIVLRNSEHNDCVLISIPCFLKTIRSFRMNFMTTHSLI
jgi:hypothetical protein